jgi:single-strand DNA-binding protein
MGLKNGHALAVFLGNLGQDPELRVTQGGQAVAKLRLAVGRSWPDGHGRFNEETSWFDLVCWGKQAEQVAERYRKGDTVYVVAEPRQRTYDGKNGKRSVVEFHVRTIRRVQSREDADSAPVDYFGDEDPGPPPAV